MSGHKLLDVKDDRYQAMNMQPQNDHSATAFKLNDSDSDKDVLLSQPASFPLFSKLPIELRFKIWHYTFPGPRKVYICNISNKSPTEQMFPTSLWIHRESRFETLNFYFVLDSQLLESPASQLPPLCFNPKTDLICFDYQDFIPYDFPANQIRRIQRRIQLQKMTQLAAPQMNKIHHIQLENLSNEGSHDSRPSLAMVMNPVTREGQYAYIADDNGDFIFHFPALKKISLTVKSWPHRDIEFAKTLYSKDIRKFVEAFEGRFNGGKAPEVLAI